MKLKLEALSPMEGIGLIRSGQSLRLVRPPYALSDAPVLAEDCLQDAIVRHGFVAAREEFDNWEQAIGFLNRQASAARRALGQEIPELIDGKAILEVMPPEVLGRFLDRIEGEIIPKQLFDHAEDFLLALLMSNAGARHPDIGARAAELLQRNKAARQKAKDGVSELANRDIRFPSLERKPELLARSLQWGERIRERGSLFEFVS